MLSVWCWQQLGHVHKPSSGALACLCLGCRPGRGNCGIKMVTIVRALLAHCYPVLASCWLLKNVLDLYALGYSYWSWKLLRNFTREGISSRKKSVPRFAVQTCAVWANAVTPWGQVLKKDEMCFWLHEKGIMRGWSSWFKLQLCSSAASSRILLLPLYHPQFLVSVPAAVSTYPCPFSPALCQHICVFP